MNGEQLDLFNYDEKPSTKESSRISTVAPTYEIHFFDKNLRQRTAWHRAKTEEIARGHVINEHGRAINIIKIKLSDRELEEIEALD